MKKSPPSDKSHSPNRLYRHEGDYYFQISGKQTDSNNPLTLEEANSSNDIFLEGYSFFPSDGTGSIEYILPETEYSTPSDVLTCSLQEFYNSIPSSIDFTSSTITQHYQSGGDTTSTLDDNMIDVLSTLTQRKNAAIEETQGQESVDLAAMTKQQVISFFENQGCTVNDLGNDKLEIEKKPNYEELGLEGSFNITTVLDLRSHVIEKAEFYANGDLQNEMLFETKTSGEKYIHQKIYRNDVDREKKNVIISTRVPDNN